VRIPLVGGSGAEGIMFGKVRFLTLSGKAGTSRLKELPYRDFVRRFSLVEYDPKQSKDCIRQA
jgi:hypothetical protein